MPAPRDTTVEAWSRHVESFRTMSPAHRVGLALAMTDELHEIARAGIRRRHPEWTASQVQESFEELVLGVELARTARLRRIAASR